LHPSLVAKLSRRRTIAGRRSASQGWLPLLAEVGQVARNAKRCGQGYSKLNAYTVAIAAIASRTSRAVPYVAKKAVAASVHTGAVVIEAKIPSSHRF